MKYEEKFNEHPNTNSTDKKSSKYEEKFHIHKNARK